MIRQCLINMERIFIVALLVALCSATSPPLNTVTPLNCNETLGQAELAIDLINEQRDEGFLFRPLRIESVFTQQSSKESGGVIYYLDLDVLETDCSVLSGKSWKECQHDVPVHETVFGHCKAIILIVKTMRILKLMNYNCTLSTVPPRAIVQICPDCPSLVKDITPTIKAKADLLIQQHNKDSNHTHYFKVDDIERVRTQYVFGQSYFFYFTIKETECLKTQTNVNLADCKFLKDNEAEVGFCKGGTYNTPERKEALHVTCEIYEPRMDHDDHNDRRHGHCHHGADHSKNEEGQEHSDAQGADGVKQEDAGEAGQGIDAPGNREHHKHGPSPHHRGHKHHQCRHDHHHHHHPHHHHHHHQNDSDPHHHHNHTAAKDGSSSEEHSDHKGHRPFEKGSKGSVQFYDITDDQGKVPVPTIFRRPPIPERPGKHGKFGKHGKHGPPDNIAFPSEHSTLSTCPGVPLVDVPEIIKKYIF